MKADDMIHGFRIKYTQELPEIGAVLWRMICDGAKASCAAKIASSVEAGLLGWQMNRYDSQFYGGDGIVLKGVENTIRAVNTLAREGMRTTDSENIRLMLQNDIEV